MEWSSSAHVPLLQWDWAIIPDFPLCPCRVLLGRVVKQSGDAGQSGECKVVA